MQSYEKFSDELKALNAQVDAIQQEADSKKTKLMQDYAFLNREFNIGDVITNDSLTIVVDKIRFTESKEAHLFRGRKIHSDTVNPYCVYSGRELTKKLTLKKSGDLATTMYRGAFRKINTYID